MKNQTYKTLFSMHDNYEQYVNETEKKIRSIEAYLAYSLQSLDESDKSLKSARIYLGKIISEITSYQEKVYNRAKNIIEKHQKRLYKIYENGTYNISENDLEELLCKHAFKQYESLCDIDTLILNTCSDVYSLKNEYGMIFDLESISKAEVECHNVRELMTENLTYLNSLQLKADLYKKTSKK